MLVKFLRVFKRKSSFYRRHMRPAYCSYTFKYAVQRSTSSECSSAAQTAAPMSTDGSPVSDDLFEVKNYATTAIVFELRPDSDVVLLASKIHEVASYLVKNEVGHNFHIIRVHKSAFCFSNTTVSNSTSIANTTDVKGGKAEIFEDGSCHFDDDFCNWSNENGSDDFDWTRRRGKTPSGNTGPMTDHGGDGFYVYAEVSWPRKPGETARLVAGPFSGAKCMRFYYHMFGRYIADLQIYLRENGMESFIWGRYKNQGNVWRYSNVTVFGQNYTVVMVARVGREYQGDIAVDDITFLNGTCDGKALNYQPRLKTLSLQKQQKGEPGTCNFDGGFCEWINLPLGDQFDWTLNSGKTGTKLTGPSEDHTGNQGGYVYIEASEPQKSQHTAQLLGPRLCGRMCLKFFYSMNGKRMGTLNVYKREGMGSDDLLWSMTGDQGTEWHEALVDIGGACYQIIFEGIVGSSYLSDSAVDDVFFTKGTCCELKMESFDAGVVGNCTFEESMCEWRNDAADDLDWRLIEGETFSMETGPSAGYGGQGQYIYVESSEPHRAGTKAVLVSGILQGLQCMRFKYHMYGVDMGSLSVYRIGDGIMRSRLWRRHGDHGQMWHEARVTLPCSSPSYMLEIEAVIGAWRSDIAIDNMEFTKGSCPPYNPSTVLPTTVAPTSPRILADVQSENNCSFAGQFCNWKNDYADDFDWLINSGHTMTTRTGPSSDADGIGGYIYLEASLQTVDQKARLISGDLSGAQCMQFHYHMWGFRIGSLWVKQVDQKRKRPRVVWFKSGNQGRRWNEARVNLVGRIYKVVIEGVRGHSFYGDIAVDAIGFTSGRCTIKEVSQEEILADSQLGSGVCSFDKNFCRWRNEATYDQFDWKITEGETPSKGTGPQNGFGGLGNYAFIESSAPRRRGDIAILQIYGSGKDRCLFFAYHMWGTGVGSLSVYQQQLDWHIPPTVLWRRSGDQGNRWKEAQVSVKGYHKYKLIIEAVRGKSYRGDIAVDEVGFHKDLCGKLSN